MQEGCNVMFTRIGLLEVTSTLTLESQYEPTNLLVFNYLATNNSYVLTYGPTKILTTILSHIHNIPFSSNFTREAFFVNENSIAFFPLRRGQEPNHDSSQAVRP
jgi:hypothetical protein